MRHVIPNAILLILAALPAAAAPILTVAPSSIELSPTQTVLTLEVDPNGTPVSTLLLNFSALQTDIEIVGIASAEPGIINVSGPALVGGEYQASFSAFFFPERAASFSIGTLTVEGFAPGGALVLNGEFTDASFNTYAIGPTNAAAVSTPEPATALLCCLGLLGLAAQRRLAAGRQYCQRPSRKGKISVIGDDSTSSQSARVGPRHT